MPITQDRMLNLIASASLYIQHVDHLTKLAYELNSQVKQGTLLPNEALERLCLEISYPVDPYARATVAEEATHFRHVRAKNDRDRDKQAAKRMSVGGRKPTLRTAAPSPVQIQAPAGMAAAKQLIRELGLENDDSSEINNMFAEASPASPAEPELETRPDYIEPTPDEQAARQAMLDQILAQRKAEREAKLPPQVVRNGKPLP